MDYRKIYAIQRANEQRIDKMLPNDNLNTTGIYCFWRIDEYGVKMCYIGKSEKQFLIKRIAQHLSSYQHIDLSIKKYGLHSEKNPYGYKITILEHCEPEKCNELERKYIEQFRHDGWVLKNVESGGTNGKTDIGERKEAKKYRDGIKQGELNAIKEIKVFFEKYLDYSIKGTPNKIKERKLQEFKEILNEK